MIIVRTPFNKDFDYETCKNLFDKHREKLDVDPFDVVVQTTHFFSFYENDKFIGCIYFYQHDRKVFVTVYAERGHQELNLKCFRMSLGWYNCDIYAEKVQKTARIGMLRCGFKKVGDDLYVYRRKK